MSYKDVLLQREFAGVVATRSSTSNETAKKKEPAEEEEVTFEYDSEETIAPPSGVATATSVATAAGKYIQMPAADEEYDEAMAEQVTSFHLPSQAEKMTDATSDPKQFFGAMLDELQDDERKMPASMLDDLSDDERKMPASMLDELPECERKMPARKDAHTINDSARYVTASEKLPRDPRHITRRRQ